MSQQPIVLAGRYRVEEELGRGGMARVYRGTDTVLGRPVAIKVLAPQFAENGRVTNRTPKVEARQHRFNRMVGFRQVGEDEFDILYEMLPEECRA